MAARRIAYALALCGATTGAAWGQDRPLSAIDWLRDEVATDPLPPLDEPATSVGAGSETIEVKPLDAPSKDAVGLLPPSRTGLPPALWGASDPAELVRLLAAAQGGTVPAMRDLLMVLLLAEARPPEGTGAGAGTGVDTGQTLFLARIDTLIEMGALDRAQALLDRAGADTAETFARWLDVSLLTGDEAAACQALVRAPDLAPSLASRIFCLAREGDWEAAALTLDTARALQALSGVEDAILERYLFPEMFEEAPPLTPPSVPSPLLFRLFEVAAEPIPTTLLPLAYAPSDLRPAAGWKAQIEAAERLARAGVIEANRLMGLYTARQPAASGGVWDRVAAVQALDAALSQGATGDIDAAMAPAWEVLAQASLEPVFAALFATRLSAVQQDLSPQAAELAFEAGLLSADYQTLAAAYTTSEARARFLKGVASGDLTGLVPPDAVAAAVADGFAAIGPPPRLAPILAQGNLGEAILHAVVAGHQGGRGDLEKLAEAIAFLRAVGLDQAARRLALDVMVLGVTP
ncbi:MAG: hypothetical protein AAF626_18115 [Pseudomonadota bacterium]